MFTSLSNINAQQNQNVFNRNNGINKPVNNRYVKLFVKYYTTIGRKYLKKAFSEMEKYFPVISKIFTEQKIPLPFILLPIITCYYKRQVSYSTDAAGLWQLSSTDARRYGLMINKYVDERFDIVKSTWVAARLIKSLKASLKHYDLVLAAYNGTETYIRKKLDESNVNSFWKLVDKTGFDNTFEYVPKFHALLTIAKNPKKYGFKGFDFTKKVYFESVHVKPKLKLEILAKILNLTVFEIKSLNYQLKGEITPPLGRNKFYLIRLPKDFTTIFKQKKYLLKPYLIETRIYYVRNRIRVRRGDNLGRIAARYRVSLRALMRLNGIRNPRMLRVGRVLYLPRKSRIIKKYRVPNPLFKDTKIYKKYLARLKAERRRFMIRERIRKRREARIRRRRHVRAVRRKRFLRKMRRLRKKRVIFYKIKPGDTVSGLASKLRVSARRIIKANRGTTKLIIGRVLRISRY